MGNMNQYTALEIEVINLDNEISLALALAPPAGPSKTFNSLQSPFKEDLGLV